MFGGKCLPVEMHNMRSTDYQLDLEKVQREIKQTHNLHSISATFTSDGAHFVNRCARSRGPHLQPHL
jgi:hypothetical protein